MFNSVQFLRFFAASVVVIYHAVIGVGAAPTVDLPEWVYRWSWVGSAGVPIFFVISGFVMYLTSFNKFGEPGASRAFLARRAIRIYPIYWVCALAYLLFPVTPARDWDVVGLLQAAFLVPGHAAAIIPPGWTLAYEMIFYLAFTLLLAFSRKRAVWLLTVSFSGAVAVGAVTEIGSLHPILKFVTNVQLLLFVAGVLIGVLIRKPTLPSGFLRSESLVAGLVLALVGFALAPVLRKSGLPDVMTLGLPSVLMVAVAVLAERAGKVPVWIMRSSFLGNGSYVLYLIHVLVIYHGSALLLGPIGSITGVAFFVMFVVFLSLLVGALIHYGIEVHVQRMLQPVARRMQASRRAKALKA